MIDSSFLFNLGVEKLNDLLNRVKIEKEYTNGIEQIIKDILFLKKNLIYLKKCNYIKFFLCSLKIMRKSTRYYSDCDMERNLHLTNLIFIAYALVRLIALCTVYPKSINKIKYTLIKRVCCDEFEKDASYIQEMSRLLESVLLSIILQVDEEFAYLGLSPNDNKGKLQFFYNLYRRKILMNKNDKSKYFFK